MSGPAGRIVVDPEQLRRLATRMQGAALLLSSSGRELSSRPLPAMAAGVAGVVAEAIAHANAELQEVATDLVREAGGLSARATSAELGGGDLGWSLPGLHPFALEPVSDVDVGESVTERVQRGEQWAPEELSAMCDSMDTSAGDSGIDPAVLDLSDPSEAAASDPLGGLTIVADNAPETFDLVFREDELVERAPGVSGALGSAFQEATDSPGNLGIVASIMVGTGLESGPPGNAAP